jgi:hypothetical protein
MKAELAAFGIALRRVSLWGVAVIALYEAWLLRGPSAAQTGHDAYAYWLVWHHHPMYGIAPFHLNAFLYSPVFAQAIWPLTLLPWLVFFAVWTAGAFAIYAWLLWPLPWWQRVPLLCMCVPQVITGNIWPLFALVILFGFRRPSLWAFPLLTKVTSAMGLVWFAARREWRLLAEAVAVSAALIGVSAAVSPGLWVAWGHLLLHGGSATTPRFSGGFNIPLAPRLPVAVILAVYAARRNRVAFLAAAVAIGSPVFNLDLLVSNLFVFAALPRLRQRGLPEPATAPVLVESPPGLTLQES